MLISELLLDERDSSFALCKIKQFPILKQIYNKSSKTFNLKCEDKRKTCAF